MTTVRSWRRRLADWISPDTSGASVIPGESCTHLVDAEAAMLRLLAAVNDPAKFADVLVGFARCPSCAAALIAQIVYTLAGAAMDEDIDPQDIDPDIDTLPCLCTSPVPAEVWGMRLVLAFAADEHTLGHAMGQLMACPNCLVAAIFSITHANVALLNGTGLSWRPLIQRNLLAALDDAAR